MFLSAILMESLLMPDTPWLQLQVNLGNDVWLQPMDKRQAISSQPRPHRSACSRHPLPTSRRARSGLGLLGTDGFEPIVRRNDQSVAPL